MELWISMAIVILMNGIHSNVRFIVTQLNPASHTKLEHTHSISVLNNPHLCLPRPTLQANRSIDKVDDPAGSYSNYLHAVEVVPPPVPPNTLLTSHGKKSSTN